jgi:autotransporter translocation and assembly factor TamB
MGRKRERPMLRRVLRRVVRWTGRGLVALLVLVLLALGGVQALLRTDWGRERARRLAVSAISGALPAARIGLGSFERLSLTEVSLRGLRLGLKGQPGEIVSVSRVRVELSPAKILGGLVASRTVPIEQVTVEDLHVELAPLPDGRWNVQALLPPSKEEPGPPAKPAVSVELRSLRVVARGGAELPGGRSVRVGELILDGRVSLLRSGERSVTLQALVDRTTALSLRGRLGEGADAPVQAGLVVDAPRIWLVRMLEPFGVKPAASLRLEASLTGRLDDAAVRVRLAPQGGGDLELAGQATLRGERSYRATLVVRALDPSRVLPSLPDGSISLRLDAALAGAGAPKFMHGRIRLRVDPSRIRIPGTGEIALLGGRVLARLDRGQVTLKPSTIRLPAGAIELSGMASVEPDGPVDLRAGIDLYRLSRLPSIPARRRLAPGLSGELHAVASIGGTRLHPRVAL